MILDRDLFGRAATGHRVSTRAMQIRVSYEFPDRNEVRYLERAPSEGSTFQHNGATWHVDTVDMDTAGGYIVRLSPARHSVDRDKPELR
jgi:hypothetical protein